jgi:hypothetical protein
MRRPRDVDAIDLPRAGVLIKCRPMRPREGWMFEGVATVARQALAVAAMRASIKRTSRKTA